MCWNVWGMEDTSYLYCWTFTFFLMILVSIITSMNKSYISSDSSICIWKVRYFVDFMQQTLENKILIWGAMEIEVSVGGGGVGGWGWGGGALDGSYSAALVSVLGWAFDSCGSVVRTNTKFGHLKKRFGRFPSAVWLKDSVFTYWDKLWWFSELVF